MLKLILILTLFYNGFACNLCGDGVNDIVNPFDLVDADGLTCAALSVKMFLYTGKVCEDYRFRHHTRCCTRHSLKPIVQNAKVIPKFPHNGPYPICELCYNNNYPQAVGMVINLLYVGIGSCNQYYELGQRGMIMTHLCSALQHFAFEPCGCDKASIHSTSSGYSSGKTN